MTETLIQFNNNNNNNNRNEEINIWSLYLDVIKSAGVSSPGTVEDVNFNLLKKAIVDGFNNRYGEGIADFQTIVI